ncbi:MAG TPA: hypothetical protein VJB35_02480 [Candidatus Nanoarchaeia archaeon]|nr:hypothetical protein [Candidatus Nanoarchaeia archaeon]
MKWTKLDKNCFEAENDKFYFHLRKEEDDEEEDEEGDWRLDIFKNNKSLKYVETFAIESLIEAKYTAETYIPYLK